MITLKALASVKEAALKEVEAAEAKQQAATDARLKDYNKVIDGFFEGVFKESDEVKVSSYNWDRSIDVSVYRGENRSEILRFAFRPIEFGKDVPFGKIETGFYSTSESSEFELERMITIGKVGSALLNLGEEMFVLLNEVKENHKAALAAVGNELAAANENLREIVREEEKLRKASLRTKLETEGVEFKWDPETWRNVSFDIKFNLEVYNVTKVKMLRTSPSGKSARLEITRMVRDIEHNWVESTFEETVRMDKLEYFLRHNSSSMINN